MEQNTRLSQRIASVLHLHDAGDTSIGGLDAASAQGLMDAIADANLADDAALRAYDICHAVSLYGRAF